MEQQIKTGDIVRLTDPISNGEIVRIGSIDEYDYASWLGGAQKCDMEPVEIEKTEISDFPISGEEYHYKISLTDKVEQIERDFGVKLYPESAVEYWKNRAEVEKKEHAYYEQAWEKEHNKLLDAQKELCAKEEENKELRQRMLLMEAELRAVD